MPNPTPCAPSTLLLALALLASCGDEAIATPEPEPIGPLVYRVTPTWCPSPCETLELYRDDARIQLLARVGEGEAREVYATLEDATVTELDEVSAALLAGELPLGELDPYCLGFIEDRPLVLLVLAGGLEFGYPWTCAPSGVAELDAIYVELVNTLPDCLDSPRHHGCEAS